MGDWLDDMKALKEQRKDEHAGRREAAEAALVFADSKSIGEYAVGNGGAHIILEHKKYGRIDYWPGTEMVQTRKDKRPRDLDFEKFLEIVAGRL